MNKKVITLGIDPGLATTGWAIIEKVNKNLKVKDFDCIFTKKELTHSQRLLKIFKETEKIVKKYQPNVIAIERLFFFKNSKTAMAVGESRGMILLVAAKYNLPIFEYTPLEIKQAIVGYGRADKKQMQKMVMRLLNLKELPKPDDAADALACAICHLHQNNLIKDARI